MGKTILIVEDEQVLREVFDPVQVETETFAHPFFGDEEANWLYFGRA